MVEAPPPRPGDMRDHPVENLTPFFVGIEVLIQEMTEKSPALRYSERFRAADRHRRLGVVFEIGDEISRRGEAQASDHRGFRGVDQLVDPRFESGLQMHESQVVDQFPVDLARKLPLPGRNPPALPARRIPDREGVARMARIGPRVFHAADAADDEVAERMILCFFGNHEVRANHARQRSRGGAGGGRVKSHQSPVVGDIELPTQPRHGEALSHQEAVTEIGGAGRIHRAAGPVDQTKNPLPAPVRYFQEKRSIPAAILLGLENEDVRGELDFALAVEMGFVQIDDLLVVRIVRPHREVGLADDLLVRPGQPETPAADHIGARRDFDSIETGFGVRGQGDDQKDWRWAQPTSPLAWRATQRAAGARG